MLVRLTYVVTIQVLLLGVNYAGEAHPTCVVDTGRAPKDSNKYAKFEISKKSHNHGLEKERSMKKHQLKILVAMSL